MFKQLIPAENWYFRHDNAPGSNGVSTVYQLAAWGLTEEGEVVGLVAVRDCETQRAKLVTPPPVPGDYLHREQLSEEELVYARKR